ncbi:hypothetical protein BDZ85DRAFT_289264, partial [Elsinoe ampelina]
STHLTPFAPGAFCQTSSVASSPLLALFATPAIVSEQPLRPVDQNRLTSGSSHRYHYLGRKQTLDISVGILFRRNLCSGADNPCQKATQRYHQIIKNINLIVITHSESQVKHLTKVT